LGKACLHRVGAEDIDNRGCGYSLNNGPCRRALRHDDIHWDAQQLKGQRGNTIGHVVAVTCLDDQVATLNITAIGEPSPKGIEKYCGRCRRAGDNPTNTKARCLSLSWSRFSTD
jgi:hypothetical protein